MKAFLSILALDARSLARDQFLFMIAFMMAAVVGLVVLAGVNRQEWGIAHVAQWMPYAIIASIITNPSSFGMMFGLILIEEAETRVRAALMVAPVPGVRMILMRMPLVWITLTGVALFLALAINASWQAVRLDWRHWLGLCLTAAFIGPAVMISIASFASNRVEALALGKVCGVFTAPALLLYLIPADAWWRWLFFVFPTAPIIEAFEAFRIGAERIGWLWLLWGAVYIAAITAFAVRTYLRRSYKITA